MRRLGWLLLLALTLSVGAAEVAHATPTPPTSRAPTRSGLSSAERRLLLAGESVTRPMAFERGGGRYVGGVAYQMVDASPAEVLSALGRTQDLPNMLPRTKSARMVGVGQKHARVELVSGTSVVEAKYTVVFSRPKQGQLRFWLDQKRPHGIRDVWGYVRVRPFGKGTLLTVAVALDVGPGLVRMLFEDRIQRAILSTPRKIRDYLEPRAIAQSR